MQFPSFSIVVPTFQRRETVADALRAIARIDYRGELEVIVVVDGSTDGTVEALRAIECPFPTKVLWQENRGLAATRNRGAAEATGEILLFLDDDMMCRPDVVEQHARSYEAGADAVLGDIPLDEGSPTGFLSASVGAWAAERAAALAGGAPITLSELIAGHMSVRRKLFEELSGFDCRFTKDGGYGNEDLDFGIRLLERHVVRFNPEAIAAQRYVVTPREAMKQRFEAGRADVIFARKHPRLAAGLFDLRAGAQGRSRKPLRLLAAMPFVPSALAALAVWLAERSERLPRPLARRLPRQFDRARNLAYWSGVRSAGGIPRGRSVLVLCYHAIADLSGDPVLGEYGIVPELFAWQLDDLAARGHAFVDGDDLLGFLSGRAAIPDKAVLLTFDDCYAELVDIARDILRPRGIPAIAFAVTAVPSGTNEWDQRIGARQLPLLDAAGLGELQRCGIEIGCHSRTHAKLNALADPDLLRETAGAADDLVAMGLPRPRFFAYPHGVVDARSGPALRRAGFQAAFGLTPGRAGRASDCFDLPRVELMASDRGMRFRRKTALPSFDRWARLDGPVASLSRRAAGRLRRLGRDLLRRHLPAR